MSEPARCPDCDGVMAFRPDRYEGRPRWRCLSCGAEIPSDERPPPEPEAA